jgi:putative ABC transport system substrate-binding protein
MQRRDFIALLGGAAWPVASRAQQAQVPVVGVLSGGFDSAAARSLQIEPFRHGLGEMGFIEDRNVAIEYRFAEDHYDNLPVLAAELVRRRVVVIATMQLSAAALAAKAATQSIPIVFTVGTDPVQLGIVKSLARPGGNATGFAFLTTESAQKRLELLHELTPSVSTIAFPFNPDNVLNEVKEVGDAARQLGLRMVSVRAAQSEEIDTAFTTIATERVGALLISGDRLFAINQGRLNTLAARHTLPAVWSLREPVLSGGLMSYGASRQELARQAGLYVGRILKGKKPADLPVQQATKFEFVINLKTAKALGLTIPETLLATADEVIQ